MIQTEAGAMAAAPDDASASAAASEADYGRRLAEIAVKRRRIVALEADVAEMRAALARFEAVCQANVGDLLADLRHVAEAIARYQRQLRDLRAQRAAEGDERPDFEIDPADFDAEPVDADEPAADDAPASSTDDAAELRRVYRDLAKRCHPDFARDDADRERRQERMLQINDAFRQRDLDALRALRHEIEADAPDFARRPLAARMAWALTELQRLDARLAVLRAELLGLRGGDLHRLWKRHEAGEPIFDDLRDDLESQLASEADRLDAAIAAWRELSGERAAASAI